MGVVDWIFIVAAFSGIMLALVELAREKPTKVEDSHDADEDDTWEPRSSEEDFLTDALPSYVSDSYCAPDISSSCTPTDCGGADGFCSPL